MKYLNDTGLAYLWDKILSIFAKKKDVVRVYNNVNEMKVDLSLSDGDVCETLGYYSTNDGGGATYKISDSGTSNGYDTIKLNNNKIASLKYEDRLNVMQFGAKGDNSTECTEIIQYVINKAIATGKSVYLPTGKYKVSDLKVETNDGIRITGEHSTNPNNSDHGAVFNYIGTNSLFKLGNDSGAAYNCLFDHFSVRAENHFDSVFSGLVNEDVFTDLTLTFKENICDYGFKFSGAQITEIKNISTSRVKTFAKINSALLTWFHHNNIWISDTGFEVNWGNFIINDNWFEMVTNGILVDNSLTSTNTEINLNIQNNHFLCEDDLDDVEHSHLLCCLGTNSTNALRVNGNATNNIVTSVNAKKIIYPFYFDKVNTDFSDGIFNLSGNVCSSVGNNIAFNNSKIVIVETSNIVGNSYFTQGKIGRKLGYHTPISFTDTNRTGAIAYDLPKTFLPTYNVEFLIESTETIKVWCGDKIMFDADPSNGIVRFSAFVLYDGTNTTYYSNINGTNYTATKQSDNPSRVYLQSSSNNFTIKYINITSK